MVRICQRVPRLSSIARQTDIRFRSRFISRLRCLLKRRSQSETEQEKRSGEFSEARQDYVVLPWPPLRGGEGGGDGAGRELPVEQQGNFVSPAHPTTENKQFTILSDTSYMRELALL